MSVLATMAGLGGWIALLALPIIIYFIFAIFRSKRGDLTGRGFMETHQVDKPTGSSTLKPKERGRKSA